MAQLLPSDRLYRFDDFELDPARRSLLRDGVAVPLSSRAFEVFSYLVRNPGRVITKDELLKAVWPESFVEEGSLAGYVSILRKTLGDRAGYIATVPGQGYQFTARVRVDTLPGLAPSPQVEALPPAQERRITETTHVVIHETSSSLPVRQPRLRRWPRWIPVPLVVLALAAASYAGWRYMHRAVPPPLVVLSDFENATGDPRLEGVLDSALQIDLEQSPYLSFLSNTQIQQTLAQMQRPKAAPFSPEVAREVCQRNNAHVLLHAVAAKFGQHYLLTLNAIDCQTGHELGQAKSEAKVADDVPHAIDLVAAEMRKRLGESRSSIRQFNTPLFDENTNSLEALQRYTQASRLGLQGKYGDAIPLFQRAIELDPNFVMAYADLASCYGNLGEHVQEKANLTKAYELRNSVAEQDRFYIAARYNESVTGDVNASIANYRLWTSIYPRNTVPWSNLGNAYTQLGQPELAIAPAREGLALNPQSASGYVILARALMHAGQLEEAKAICEQAIAKAVAGGDLHSLLMEIDVARHDPEGIKDQLKWAETSPNPSRMKLNQALLAFSRGQVQLGRQTIAAMVDDYNAHGMAALGTRYQLASTRILAEEGYLTEARKLLDTLTLVPGLTDPLVALAEVGEPDRASAILKREMSEHPQDTLWLGYKQPQIEAAVQLATHKPQAALDALRHAQALDYRGYDTLLLRGQTYLELKQPAAAAQEFRKILDHPGIDPFSYEYPLAQLGLARALAAQGNQADSAAAYRTLLTMWKDADPDFPALQQARKEFMALSVQ